MNTQTEFPVLQENLIATFNNRAEKLFDRLDDGKDVTFLDISKSNLLFILEGKKVKPSKFMLAFYSPDGEFHFHFDARKYPYDISDGRLQLFIEDEHVLLIAPNGKKFCSGYKHHNSTDFSLFYYFETEKICGFYGNDPQKNFCFDVWNSSGGIIAFESLFAYIHPLGAFSSAPKEQEELFDENDLPFELF